MQLVLILLLVVLMPSKSYSLNNIEKMCLKESAEINSLDHCLLQAVLEQEGGTPGLETHHANGSIDIGRGQINKGGAWAKRLEEIGISEEQLRDNPCINILSTAFILRSEIDSVGGDIPLGVANYHRGLSKEVTPLRARYFLSVYKRLSRLKSRGLCS